MNGCVYCNDGKCMKYTTDVVTSYCYGEGYPCMDRRISNGDRIRAMTDERLAEFASKLGCHPNASKETCKGVKYCIECWLEWLKRESTNEP